MKCMMFATSIVLIVGCNNEIFMQGSAYFDKPKPKKIGDTSSSEAYESEPATPPEYLPQEIPETMLEPAPRVPDEYPLSDPKHCENSYGVADRRLDLTQYLTLAQADLSNTQLHAADLTEVNMQKTKLVNVQWSDVRFNRANLLEADFTCADLGAADFSGANLRRVSFIHARLAGVFVGADLTETDFTLSTIDPKSLRRAAIIRNTRLPDGRLIQSADEI